MDRTTILAHHANHGTVHKPMQIHNISQKFNYHEGPNVINSSQLATYTILLLIFTVFTSHHF